MLKYNKEFLQSLNEMSRKQTVTVDLHFYQQVLIHSICSQLKYADESIRAELAEKTQDPALSLALADDPSITVRIRLAENTRDPEALRNLLGDYDETVRDTALRNPFLDPDLKPDPSESRRQKTIDRTEKADYARALRKGACRESFTDIDSFLTVCIDQTRGEVKEIMTGLIENCRRCQKLDNIRVLLPEDNPECAGLLTEAILKADLCGLLSFTKEHRKGRGY